MMRATIARRHMEGIVRVMQKPENLEKHLRPAAPETEVRLLSDSADSGRLGGAQPADAAGHRVSDGPCAGGAERLVCLGRADSGGHSGCQHRQRAHQGGATAHRGGHRHPGGKNRAPAGRALAADSAAVLFPRPHDRQHPWPPQSQPGGHGEADQADVHGLRPRRDHRSGGGGHDLHAAARLRGVAGGAGDSRGYLHRASPDRQARRRASAWS